MNPLERVKYVLAQLPRADQAALAEYLNGLLLTPEEVERLLDPSQPRVVATVTSRRPKDAPVGSREPTVTYRLERVKCGKKGCTRCPHGPYVYKYWREGGRLRKQYGGKPRLAAPEEPQRSLGEFVPDAVPQPVRAAPAERAELPPRSPAAERAAGRPPRRPGRESTRRQQE